MACEAFVGQRGAVTSTSVLAFAPHSSPTATALADAATRRGMRVVALYDGFVPSDEHTYHYYGGPRYARPWVAPLGLALLEPPADWTADLTRVWTRRQITPTTLGDARRLRCPVFVKPPTDKSFPAAVYADGTRLPRADEYPADTPVHVSDVVTFAVEYRLFILDGRVHAASRYARFGRLAAEPLAADPHRDDVLTFAEALLSADSATLPSAVVVDVGLISDPDRGIERWAVVEANMAWFSNSYAADPDRVLDVVLRAAGPHIDLMPADLRFADSVQEPRQARDA